MDGKLAMSHRRGSSLFSWRVGGARYYLGLTLGLHFALNILSTAWGCIATFGIGLGLIFAISIPQPLPLSV
jgi:hypothetical protein